MPATNYCRVITLLEPELNERLTELSNQTGYNRTKLIRMMVKHCIVHPRFKDSIAGGDPPASALELSDPTPPKKKGKK